MVEKTIQKLTGGTSNDDLDETADEILADEVKTKIKPSHKNKTFTHLSSWYLGLPNKKPLIIVLQDLESFSTQQLQDFVLLCR